MSDLPQSVFAARILQGEPITAPGAPKNYPAAKKAGDGGLYKTHTGLNEETRK
jgi:hypothetical protein